MRRVKSPTVMSSSERVEVVRSCRYVDEVIEDCPAILVPEFMAKLRIDYIGYDEESLSAETADPYKFLKSQNNAFVIPKTRTINSADIVSRIIGNRDLFM